MELTMNNGKLVGECVCVREREGERENEREGGVGEREGGRALGVYLVKKLLLISQSLLACLTCPSCRSASSCQGPGTATGPFAFFSTHQTAGDEPLRNCSLLALRCALLLYARLWWRNRITGRVLFNQFPLIWTCFIIFCSVYSPGLTWIVLFYLNIRSGAYTLSLNLLKFCASGEDRCKRRTAVN